MNRDLREIEDWVALARKADYQIDLVAALCHCSLRELERHFDECRCLPPEAWMIQVRLFDAFRLIVEGQAVKEAAQNTGFKGLSHFYHRFTNYFGAPPLQLLRIYRQAEREKRQAANKFAELLPEDWRKHDRPFYAKALAILSRAPRWSRNLPELSPTDNKCRSQTIDAR